MRETGGMIPEKQVLERTRKLIQEGRALLAQKIPPPDWLMAADSVPDEPYTKWRTQIRALHASTFGASTVYAQNVENVKQTGYAHEVEEVLGCLSAFAEDLEAGYLRHYKDLVVAEVFSDFLEMAEHLLTGHYFQPAASLIGAVLEDDLRRRCDARGLTYDRKRDGLDALSKKLVTAGEFNALMKKKIDTWAKIRNDADHGNFAEFREEDVAEMLTGVTGFCGSASP